MGAPFRYHFSDRLIFSIKFYKLRATLVTAGKKQRLIVDDRGRGDGKILGVSLIAPKHFSGFRIEASDAGFTPFARFLRELLGDVEDLIPTLELLDDGRSEAAE